MAKQGTKKLSTAEIINGILKSEDPVPSFHEFDVTLLEDQLKKFIVEERRKWSKAAYDGDWDTIFRMINEGSALLINSTRLAERPKNTAGMHKPPTGFSVLHQESLIHNAAWHGAPVDVVKAFVRSGAYRWQRTTDEKENRPIDIAREKGFSHLYDILEPIDLLPHLSEDALRSIQEQFNVVLLREARGIFRPEEMRIPDIALLREIGKLWIPIPGMYGGFNIWFEGDHMISESFCRVAGGSGMTYHITPDEAKLVDSGWG